MSRDPNVIRIKPHFYIHVLDNNSNITRVETGPLTYTRQDHEKIVEGPTQMIMVPPRHYCIISNPVVKEGGKVSVDEHGNYRLRHGDEEIRFEQEPFPLYPGEKLFGKVNTLQVVEADAALRLRAIRDFDDRVAGDEWIFQGPGTYTPRVEVQVVEVIRSTIIKPNTALKLRARQQCVDSEGKKRESGEEWLVRRVGAYLPRVDEQVIEKVDARVLTDKRAFHIRALKTFTDVFGKKRRAGEEWLVTLDDAETHIPDVYEEVVGEVKITTLTNRQYCVILDPVDKKTGLPQLGKKELRVGPISFFLQPGERLEAGIQNVYVLAAEESLLLRAREAYTDGESTHSPGDRWMISGPRDYVPPVEVEIVETRRYIPLDENEGVYIRDLKTGRVRMVVGESYLLKANEELWAKELPDEVEDLLERAKTNAETRGAHGLSKGGATTRDKSRVVTYRAPHGSVVQVYDYKLQKARLIFGPELIMLSPDEQFTVLNLSGDTPKRSGVITSLSLLLGPDFMTDVVIVETADHARLSLKLAYNWHFAYAKDSPDSHKMFRVPDFVGDACKAIASRVRGAVAAVSFDKFHRNSSEIIMSAVFGIDPETGKQRKQYNFPANGLVLTNIDIQSVEPVDQRTRDALQKSVQLAIEITTKSQEANARHEAERVEQEAKGRLERQKIHDEAEAEKSKKTLLSLQAQSAAVEATGQATAEAKARAEAAQIEGEAAVKQAQLKAESKRIKAIADLEQLRKKNEQEVAYTKAKNQLEVSKAQALAAIEAKKFKDVVDSIGPETIKKIAQAGPEMQAKLLGGLGLKSVMITDGSSPINLFSTAGGLIGSNPQ
jgi:major vault protein